MPFKSLAQEGYMHEHPEILGPEALKEFDEATKGKKLPKRLHPKKEEPKKAVVRMRHTAR
jgi:hypothetical protein